MSLFCKDCKHCDTEELGICLGSLCEAVTENNYVTGGTYHPRCSEINLHGLCKFWQPKVAKPVYLDALGREFNVQDTVLVLKFNLAKELMSVEVVMLKELSHDTLTGQLRVFGHKLHGRADRLLVGMAGERFKQIYKLGSTNEFLKVLS